MSTKILLLLSFTLWLSLACVMRGPKIRLVTSTPSVERVALPECTHGETYRFDWDRREWVEYNRVQP